MVQATCIDNKEYEWLLKKEEIYEVDSWTKNVVRIKHPRLGIFGFFRNRFMFQPPTENVCSKLEDGHMFYKAN